MRAAVIVPPAVRTSTPALRRLHACAPASARKCARPGERPRQEIRDTLAADSPARFPASRIAACALMPVIRCTEAEDSQRPGSPAAFRASNSFRSAFTLSGSRVKYTESHSQRPAFSFSARMVFARSRVARPSDFQTSRAAARPNRPARSPKSRSGSCISSAVLATVLPWPTIFDSTSATRTPASANR